MNKGKRGRETHFCGLCGEKLKTNQELCVHTQLCHSEDLLNLRDMLDGKSNLSCQKCPLCDLNFISPYRLLIHMVSFHDKELKSLQDELIIRNLSLSCPFCNKVSLSQDLLKEHMATNHLDKLIIKPNSVVSNTVSTVGITCPTVSTLGITSPTVSIEDISDIKVQNNGSVLPLSKLLTKQEKILCPDCGLFFLNSYFEHHKCASGTYSGSAKKFVCSESQCTHVTFYKLIHLLTHLQQAHDKTNSHLSTFESLTQFLEWLNKEESQANVKYVKALQRMKQGKLNTVWICHRFHTDMDVISSSESYEKSKAIGFNQCYSRIHTETTFNMSTSRYDGKTIVKYHPEHKHSSDNLLMQNTEEISNTTLPEQLISRLQLLNTEEQVKDDDNTESSKNERNIKRKLNPPQLLTSEDLKPSNADSKDGLLERMEVSHEFSESDDETISAFLSRTVASPNIKKKKKAIRVYNKHNSLKRSLNKMRIKGKIMSSKLSGHKFRSLKGQVKKKKKLAHCKASVDWELVEKTLGEQDGDVEEGFTSLLYKNTLMKDFEKEPLVVKKAESVIKERKRKKIGNVAIKQKNPAPKAQSNCTPRKNKTSKAQSNITPRKNPASKALSNSTPRKTPASKASSKSTPRKNSAIKSLSNSTPHKVKFNKSLSSKTNKKGYFSEAVRHKSPKKNSKQERGTTNKTESDTEEENSYMLPADMKEWTKLFELIAFHLNSGILTLDDTKEAKKLLMFENNITTLPIEKQVDVFNRLLVLAEGLMPKL